MNRRDTDHVQQKRQNSTNHRAGIRARIPIPNPRLRLRHDKWKATAGARTEPARIPVPNPRIRLRHDKSKATPSATTDLDQGVAGNPEEGEIDAIGEK